MFSLLLPVVFSLIRVLLLLLVLLLIALVLLLVYLAYCQVANRLYYESHRCNIPRAKELPFIGSMRFEEPHETELNNFKKYGSVYVATRINDPIIMVADPEIIHLVLAKSVQFPFLSLQKLL